LFKPEGISAISNTAQLEQTQRYKWKPIHYWMEYVKFIDNLFNKKGKPKDSNQKPDEQQADNPDNSPSTA